MSSPREAACNNTVLLAIDSARRSNQNNFMSCPVASSPGSTSIVTLSIQVCLTFRIVLIDFLLSICNFFLVDFFFAKKNHTEVHMLFQVLSGFKPIFYATHPNEEPYYFTIKFKNAQQLPSCCCAFNPVHNKA